MHAKDWIREAIEEEHSAEMESEPTLGYLARDEETGVVVREAVVEDAPLLAAVGARSFRHAHASVLHPVDLAGDLAERFNESEMRRELRETRFRWLIALWHGEAVGLAQLGTACDARDLPSSRPVQLLGLYVAPDWSGNGVGSSLIEACSKLAEACGYESIWVRAWEGNRAAIAFLRSSGFVETGHEITAVGRKSVGTVLILSRPLAPTAAI